MLGKLVPCGGGPPIPLLKPRLLVGRKPECDVVLVCSSVSSRHCLLEFEEGVWWVQDLESKNGTTVNGRRCEKQRIAPNEVLSVGRQRLMVEYRPSAKPAGTQKTSPNFADEDLAFDFLCNAAQEPSAVPIEPLAVSPKVSNPAVAPVSQKEIPRSDLGRLVPCGGGVPIALRSPALVLGRSPECDIRIRFPSVSSRHCRLEFDKGYWLVEDLNSTNGTWVDGDRCMYQCLLPESVLALHKHRFTIHYVPQGTGSPPEVKRLFSQSLLEKAGLAKVFSDDRLSGQLLTDDTSDRPKKYNLLDPDDD